VTALLDVMAVRATGDPGAAVVECGTPGRARAVQPELLRACNHDIRVEGARFLQVRVQERTVAQHVDKARRPHRVVENFIDGALRESQLSIGQSRHGETVTDVSIDFVAREQLHAAHAGNALAQLAQIVALQDVAQLGLPHQERGVALEVEQHHLICGLDGRCARLAGEE
jgi:hypothetical protein